jgi:DNA-binding NarL/FixJ family response regulator
VATALLEEALATGRGLGDEDGMAWALHGLGRVAYARSDYDRTKAVSEDSLTHFEQAGDVAGCAYALYLLANVARDRGDGDAATGLYREGVARAREGRDAWGAATVLFHWGNLASAQGNCNQAITLYREGLALYASLAAKWGIALCVWGLTGACGAQGLSQRAARLSGAEQALHQQLGIARRRDPSAYERGVAAARAALGEERFEALAAEGRAMSLDEVVAYALSADDAPAHLGRSTEKRAPAPTRAPLTSREREVAVLIARGFSNRQIAAALVITPRTADTHVMNILTKLEIHSRAQVAAWAVEHGLLAEPESR